MINKCNLKMSIIIAQQIKIMMRYHHRNLGNQLLKGQTTPKTQNADREKMFSSSIGEL